MAIEDGAWIMRGLDWDDPSRIQSWEELIGWSEASLRAPLTGAGARRFSEVFAEICPEQGEHIFGLTPKMFD